MAAPSTPDDCDPLAAAEVRYGRLLLLVSVVLIGACGLMYELVLGAVASYLVGDSVTQYSLVIGAFLAAMGLGAWLTQWIDRHLLRIFLLIQLAVGLVGGFSSIAVFFAFAHTDDVTPTVVACTLAVGTLVGMEIPLMLRLLRGEAALRVTVAHVLSADYLGALAASVAFPFLVLPLLGLVRSALAFGMLNVLIGSLGTALFWRALTGRRRLVLANFLAWGLILFGMAAAGQTTSWLEDRLYQDEIILAETTPYQRIVVTRWRDDYRLHLDGHLQFSSADEYRYHEALVLPAIGAARSRPGGIVSPKDDSPQHGFHGLRVLILGGGDGLAARQVLHAATADVGRIDLVDIDRRVVELFRDNRNLKQLNDGALADPRVVTHFADAMLFLREADRPAYDVIIMDLPDPSSVATNKLYTSEFFGLALRRLRPGGVLVTQASSPFYARRTFWCIRHTLAAAIDRLPAGGGRIVPYHVYVPSFGDWGFLMVLPRSVSVDQVALTATGRFLTDEVFAGARTFSPDSGPIETQINRLDAPVLVRYHVADWSRWGE